MSATVWAWRRRDRETARWAGGLGSDELHQRAGPAVGGEGEIRVRIEAGHLDIGGQTLASCRVSVPPVPPEFSTKLKRRSGQEKVRRVDRVAGPETADRAGELLRLLEDERVRAGLVDGLPGRNARVELKNGAFERLKDPAPPTAPANSSVSEAIEIEPLLVVAPDTLRAAKFVPLPVRKTAPAIVEGCRRNGVRRRERGCCRCPEGRCWSASPPPSGSIRRRRGWRRDGCVRSIDERAGRRHRGLVCRARK